MSKQYPAGRYYVGDLCYFKGIDWDAFCAATIDGYKCLDGDFVIGGRETWHHDTAYGDGCYLSNVGLDFAVDAGLIGIVALRKGEVAPEGGHEITFDEPFIPHYEDGTFHIGHVTIWTEDE